MRLIAVLLSCLAAVAFGGACDGDDDARADGGPANGLDAGRQPSSLPAQRQIFDGGQTQTPPKFEPPLGPDPIEAHADAAAAPASDEDAAVPSQDGCVELPPGELVKLAGELRAEQTWPRVEPQASCPAARVSTYEVAYVAYELCPSSRARSVDLTMYGADRLDLPLRDAVADPMLVVYSELSDLRDDPFACLAINDDGEIDGTTGNSSRIEALELPAGQQAVIVATSRERPDQHGLGSFELALRAR